MDFLKALLLSILTLFCFADADPDDVNTLTIRTSLDKSKSYKIKKIRKDGEQIIIETYGKEKCVIPMNKIVDKPRPKYQGCTYCFEDDVAVESYYSQMFLNRRNPIISCDVHNGETVGFNFIGLTSVNGESQLVNQGMMFDSAVYSDGPFEQKEKKPNAVEKLLDTASDLLLKLAF